jgi:hypothetical protein
MRIMIGRLIARSGMPKRCQRGFQGLLVLGQIAPGLFDGDTPQ